MAGGRRGRHRPVSWSSSRQSTGAVVCQARAAGRRWWSPPGPLRPHGPACAWASGWMRHLVPAAQRRAPHQGQQQPQQAAPLIRRRCKGLCGCWRHLFHRHRIDHAVEQAIGSFFRSRKRPSTTTGLSEWRTGVLARTSTMLRPARDEQQVRRTAVSKMRLRGLGVQRRMKPWTRCTVWCRACCAVLNWGSTAVWWFFLARVGQQRQGSTSLRCGRAHRAFGANGRGRCPGALWRRQARAMSAPACPALARFAPGAGSQSTATQAGPPPERCAVGQRHGVTGAVSGRASCRSICQWPGFLRAACSSFMQTVHPLPASRRWGGLVMQPPWRGGAGCRPGFPCRYGFAPVRRRRPAAGRPRPGRCAVFHGAGSFQVISTNSGLCQQVGHVAAVGLQRGANAASVATATASSGHTGLGRPASAGRSRQQALGQHAAQQFGQAMAQQQA